MKERYQNLLVFAVSLAAPLYSNVASACVYANFDKQSVATPVEGIRWPGRYYECAGPAEVRWVNDTQDVNVWFAFYYAAENWNQYADTTGVRFVPAETRAQAQLVVSETNADWNGDGIAATDYVNESSGDGECARYWNLSKATTEVNVRAIQSASLTYGQIYGTAVHELGHVLGLAHDDNGCTVMKPLRWARQEGGCNVFDVTPADAACVAAQYALHTLDDN
jgi:hypothetical protein